MSAALFGEAVLWSWDFAHGLSWPPEGPVLIRLFAMGAKVLSSEGKLLRLTQNSQRAPVVICLS